MNLIHSPFNGLMIIEPKIFADERGLFFEFYNKNNFKEAGIDVSFVQDNISVSKAGVLRGLHFQHSPYAQGKLVFVMTGKVSDVVVDIRKDSPTYGKHFMIELSAMNRKMLWIPEGFAHGFLTLEDHTTFVYKCTSFYNKDMESGIIWNDPSLNINWGITSPDLSEKDKLLPKFLEL
jgi:dTDP-4-dehydrorhamnose 3,5-epimerase